MAQWNYSNISQDEQNKLLDDLQNICDDEEYVLHVLLILYISQKPGKKKYLIFEEEEYINQIERYIDRLSPDSEAMLVPVIGEGEFIGYAKQFLLELIEAKNLFDIIFFPAWLGVTIKSSDFLKGLLASNGIVIIHGQDNNFEIPKYLMIDRVVDTKGLQYTVLIDNRTMFIAAKERLKLILEDIRHRQSFDDNDLAKLISEICSFEKYINENRDIQKIHEYCYYINEIKNILLDIYVEKNDKSRLYSNLFNILDITERSLKVKDE